MSGCSHSHSHHHHSQDHHSHNHGDGKLSLAFVANLLLSGIQLVAGILSGSLALIADAVHNLSDAASLLMAIIARKIGRWKPDSKRTYGYKKAETLSAYTNYVVLILISLWLMGEAIVRFIDPEPVVGWTVVWVSALAIVVNLGTVALTFKEAKHSHNVRAAYLHNLGDALTSVGVIVAGLLIVTFGWWWVDPLITLAIAAFILWHVVMDIKPVVNVLIDGTPDHLNGQDIVKTLEEMDGVLDIHHFHLRLLDENNIAIEAHVLVDALQDRDALRFKIKTRLHDEFDIHHAFLEIETEDCGNRACC